ncbi:leucine-rich repeat domain-containing protein [Colwellia sp. BRX10-4]|jgi:Leucine-rich repeat (LRR) protein|uniref:leucine-rich repeat domain-containing protein n=1 Tax=Colwellia sp. BRX10-4 TaxID=2759843 RepID=UPI0015F38F03|nr:leucine-rich repeat domain-containing protein [Colwellia sp. BRX10-4]MBA6397143.1 leucine-rich repeat domain-containing protein [Colwellia sp. BRX10-4]
MSDSFKKSDEWGALLKLLRLGQKKTTSQPILWVGAGLSVPAGYPTTNQLIELLKEESVKPLPTFSPNDITLAIDSVNRSFTLWIQSFAEINGYGRLNNALASIFSKLPNVPTSTHLALTTNPWKSIFTTNYDQLLEIALNKNEVNFNIVTQENNYGLEQSDVISLYKIHGSVTNIREWTLDEKSYLNFSDKYPFLNAKLKTTLFPHPIVYVGCSMLDPRVIEWYQYNEEQELSSQLDYSIVIIKEDTWQSLPDKLKDLYLRSNMHPLFFNDFDELPLLFNAINNELEDVSIENSVEISNLDAEQKTEREKQILDDLLYETVSPRIIDIVASLWLETPQNISYIERLKELGGAKAKNKGEIAFKTLLEDFVELSKKLIGNKLEFEYQQKVFLLLDSVLSKHFPEHQTIEAIDFDPHTVYGSLQVHTTKEVGVDDHISQEFKRILKGFCELIIDCSRALPTWTKDNLITQLTDHNILFENVRDELSRWNNNTLNEIDEVVLIEDEFRRAIARRFDELKIFGLSFGKRTRKYQLSVAYISLTTETDFNNSEDNKVMSTNEALTCYKRLVILGEAGQGKTTLLQWLTVQCGRRSFGGDQANFNKKIPVLIQLRSVLNENSLPEDIDFYDFMAEGIEIKNPHREWIKSILENKLAIIMIDGFDEVPKNRRKQVLDWIDRLCNRYDGNQFILTSRPSAYENTSLEHLDFNVIQLQTMDRKAQSDFVEHWHRAIALEYDKTKPDALKKEAMSLLGQLRQQKVLRNLAQNPLLCGVLCMLHHDRNGYLPKDKTDLYESTCRLFLDSRDREKKVIETDNFMLLDIRSKESFLSDIAFWMTNNGKTSISPKDLKQRLSSKCRDMPELRRKISPDELELFFLERSGLLVQVGVNEIQFTHRTFQEFYTAKYIISEYDNDSLSTNAGNDYWNGTIQLAIGLRTSKTENERYLTKLLSKATEFESSDDSNSAISLYLLVLSCKESMREITPRFSYRLEDIIRKVVPPPSAKVRDALVSAGGIAIPYLARPKGRQSIKNDHYCALALIKIATPDAYIMLKDYFIDSRRSYIQKLCSEIKKMDSEVIKDSNLIAIMVEDGIQKYDQSIRLMLSFLNQETSLIEDGIDQDVLLGSERQWKLSQGLIPLVKLNKNEVIKLDLSYCYINDLSIINKFRKLEHIDLQRATISKFPQLDNLVNLEYLNLESMRVKHINSFSDLGALSNLKTLKIAYTHCEDISFISRLNHLEYLDLNNIHISDLNPLANLTRLQYLNISRGNFDNIDVLSNLSELTSLDISFTYIENMSCLASLTNFKKLNMKFSKFSKNHSLEKLSFLNELYMCGNPSIDMSVLKGFNKLKKLDLSHSEITDLSVLNTLTELTELDLSNNNITNITSLKNLPELSELRLCNNKVVNIAPLKNLKKLRTLDLNRNKIIDIAALKSLQKLENLNLSQNKVKDVATLKYLHELKSLNLSKNDISSISALSPLINMLSIDVSYTKIQSLKGLEKWDKLNYLHLQGVGERDIDVSSIVNLPDIRYIHFGYHSAKSYKKINFKSNPNIF